MHIQEGVGGGPNNRVNPQSSITMRLLQQKQARESQRFNSGMGGVAGAGPTDGQNEMNLYAANPFGGLQAPVAVSSGESDQTYNMGARTSYGGMQNTGSRNGHHMTDAPNPLDTQGSKFIAV